MLVLGGRGDDQPPGDEGGLRAFASTLRTMTISDAIGPAKLVAGVERFRFPASRLLHYERLDDFPAGLLPIGDAVCRFNPIFGQGMSVAALQGLALGRVLAGVARGEGELGRVWRPFFKKVVEVVDAPWALAAVPDFVFPGTAGERPADLESSLRFSAALTRACARHFDIHKLAAEVQHLVRPRRALLEPGVLERIMAEMAS